jgi:hypothetical protein
VSLASPIVLREILFKLCLPTESRFLWMLRAVFNQVWNMLLKTRTVRYTISIVYVSSSIIPKNGHRADAVRHKYSKSVDMSPHFAPAMSEK